jgi:hypothetical protein
MSDENDAERFLRAAEVLSPSSTRKLIDVKPSMDCQALDNLYATAIEPRKFWVEIYAKSRGWEPVILPDEAIEMPEFGLPCSMADRYRRTPLDPRRLG